MKKCLKKRKLMSARNAATFCLRKSFAKPLFNLASKILYAYPNLLMHTKDISGFHRMPISASRLRYAFLRL